MLTDEPPRVGPRLIALWGLPGSGKSTTTSMILNRLRSTERVAVVKIALPLYNVQHAFYARLGERLAVGQQDGQLLNFLGSHIRRVSPEFLIDDFAFRVGIALSNGADTIICDDARPADIDALSQLGFDVVRIWAPDTIRRRRKADRGDRVAGDDDHPTEHGADAVATGTVLDNSGSLLDLEAATAAMCKRWRSSPPPPARRDWNRVGLDGLVGRVSDYIAQHYRESRHQIGTVIVDDDGNLYFGLHLEAMVGRASSCAENAALAQAMEHATSPLRVIISVRHPKPSEPHDDPRVVPPCGLCRELVLDHAPDISVAIDDAGDVSLMPLSDLLPKKYVGTKWQQPQRKLDTQPRVEPGELRGSAPA